MRAVTGLGSAVPQVPLYPGNTHVSSLTESNPHFSQAATVCAKWG
jgi:hypothetical protein